MEYWKILNAVQEITGLDDLRTTDKFLDNVVERVMQDAGEDWNADDIRIAIRNELNELIEKFDQ